MNDANATIDTDIPANELAKDYALIKRESLAKIRKLAEDNGLLDELQALGIQMYPIEIGE